VGLRREAGAGRHSWERANGAAGRVRRSQTHREEGDKATPHLLREAGVALLELEEAADGLQGSSGGSGGG
jgi:hypothetical protein